MQIARNLHWRHYAKVGKGRDVEMVGKFGRGTRNERREKWLQCCGKDCSTQGSVHAGVFFPQSKLLELNKSPE